MKEPDGDAVVPVIRYTPAKTTPCCAARCAGAFSLKKQYEVFVGVANPLYTQPLRHHCPTGTETAARTYDPMAGVSTSASASSFDSSYPLDRPGRRDDPRRPPFQART